MMDTFWKFQFGRIFFLSDFANRRHYSKREEPKKQTMRKKYFDTPFLKENANILKQSHQATILWGSLTSHNMYELVCTLFTK